MGGIKEFQETDKSLCSRGSHLAHSFFLCCLWCSAPGLVGLGRWAGSPESLRSPLTSCRLWRLKVCALLWQWCVARPHHGKKAKWDCEAVTFIRDNKWTAVSLLSNWKWAGNRREPEGYGGQQPTISSSQREWWAVLIMQVMDMAGTEKAERLTSSLTLLSRTRYSRQVTGYNWWEMGLSGVSEKL